MFSPGILVPTSGGTGVTPPTEPPLWDPYYVQKVEPSFSAAANSFGGTVAMTADGAYAFVEDYSSNNSANSVSDQGIVYVYERDVGAGVWNEIQVLQASDRGSTSFWNFGSDIGVSDDGSVLVIGAQRAHVDGTSDAGQAYVFTGAGGVWTEVATMVADNKSANDWFGKDVAVSGDGTIIAIAGYNNQEDVQVGAVYFFTDSGANNWVIYDKVTSTDPAQYGFFGENVSLNYDGTVMTCGQYGGSSAGAIAAQGCFVFRRELGGPFAPDWAMNRPVPDLFFGKKVAISPDGNTVVFSEPDSSASGTSGAGRIHVFKNIGINNWGLTVIDPPAPVTSGTFGYDVVFTRDGNFMFIGEAVLNIATIYIYDVFSLELAETIETVISGSAIGLEMATNQSGDLLMSGYSGGSIDGFVHFITPGVQPAP